MYLQRCFLWYFWVWCFDKCQFWKFAVLLQCSFMTGTGCLSGVSNGLNNIYYVLARHMLRKICHRFLQPFQRISFSCLSFGFFITVRQSPFRCSNVWGFSLRIILIYRGEWLIKGLNNKRESAILKWKIF